MSAMDDFVVYAGSHGPGPASLLGWLCANIKSDEIRLASWLESWFQLPWLIDSRMSLSDKRPINTLEPETCMGFPGRKTSHMTL